MLHLSVAYDMNTKKHGIGHTQHREGDFKFFYVHSPKLNHSSAILSDVRGALLLKKMLVLNVSQSELSPCTWTYYLIGRQ